MGAAAADLGGALQHCLRASGRIEDDVEEIITDCGLETIIDVWRNLKGMVDTDLLAAERRPLRVHVENGYLGTPRRSAARRGRQLARNSTIAASSSPTPAAGTTFRSGAAMCSQAPPSRCAQHLQVLAAVRPAQEAGAAHPVIEIRFFSDDVS